MSETRMVAIDGATNVTGCALFVNGELKDYGKIDLSKSKLPTNKRILEMGKRILQTLDIWKPSIVYIEQPQGHGKNLSVSGMIHELIGIAEAWCIRHDAWIEQIPPTEWRRIIGFTQGKKETRVELKKQSVQAVLDLFGINTTDDVSDAILLGCAMIDKYSNGE